MVYMVWRSVGGIYYSGIGISSHPHQRSRIRRVCILGIFFSEPATHLLYCLLKRLLPGILDLQRVFRVVPKPHGRDVMQHRPARTYRTNAYGDRPYEA